MREEIKRYKALHKKPEVRKKSLKEMKIEKRRKDAALRRKNAGESGKDEEEKQEGSKSVGSESIYSEAEDSYSQEKKTKKGTAKKI